MAFNLKEVFLDYIDERNREYLHPPLQEIHRLPAAATRKRQRPAPRRTGAPVPIARPEGRGRGGGSRHDGPARRLLRAVSH